MLSSITPLGERGRASRWSTTATAYVVGSVAGGLLLGAVLGAVGQLLPLERPWVAAGALVALVLLAGSGLLTELGHGPRLRWPRRQVDEDWLHRYRGWVYGLGYGFQLGLGVVTIITSATFYVVVALMVLTGSPGRAATLGAIWGATRALPVLALRSVRTSASLAAAARRADALAPVARRTAAAALTVVAASAVLLVGTGGHA